MINIIKRTWFLPALAIALAFSLIIAAPVSAAEDDATEESTSSTAFSGQLIELSSTEAPTTIIVRENPTGEFTDRTVDVTTDTTFKGAGMDDWITGDSIRVEGVLNENTGVVTASSLSNLSINKFKHKGLNGWIDAIDESASTMTVQWAGEQHVVNVTENTRMVVPPTNPASLSDFQVGDRIRLRLNKDSEMENEAKIIVALRRGNEIFLKARTRGFRGTLEEIDVDAKEMTVTLSANAHLRNEDVNNLVGVEGELMTITWDDNTKMVRKYKGRTTADEFISGDKLFIVGRVGDDGVVHARLIKDNSIFRKDVKRHSGRVVSVDTATNTIEARLLKTKQLWTVTYSDDAEIIKNGKDATEDNIKRGDIINVEGTANSQTKSVAADKISLKGKLHKAKKRVRKLEDIVKHRIRTSLGQVRAEEVVEVQEEVGTAEELTEEEEAELEEEAEEELSEEPEEETDDSAADDTTTDDTANDQT